LCGVGAKAVNWAYAWSGAIALGLLVYLVVALLRAEDL
jgi:K+-transporting ATPase KdpF subunit